MTNDVSYEYKRVTCTERQTSIGCLIFIGHFLQKSPIINGSFAENDCDSRHPMGLRHPVVCVFIRVMHVSMYIWIQSIRPTTCIDIVCHILMSVCVFTLTDATLVIYRYI